MEDAKTTLQEELEAAMLWNCSWLILCERVVDQSDPQKMTDFYISLIPKHKSCLAVDV
jgi:hypothetical protein